MLETSARLLRLLSLLQTHRDWSGADLADRLGVTPRTVRRDVDKLRELGCPVNAARGTGGGYLLGAGAELPPLLLDGEEAVAVAVGLRTRPRETASRASASPPYARWPSWSGRTGAPSGRTGSLRPRPTAPASSRAPRPPRIWRRTSREASRSPSTRDAP